MDILDKTGLTHLISKIKTDYVSNNSLTATLSGYLTSTDADKKYVPKTNVAYRSYATGENGKQMTYGLDANNPTPLTVVLRGAYGNIAIGEPVDSSDATTKNYVDSHIASDIYEANVKFGGKDSIISGSVLDMALVSTSGADRFAFLKTDCWTAEYSRDGGKTWIAYKETAAWSSVFMSALNSIGSANLLIGAATDSDTPDSKWMLRLTFSPLLDGDTYPQLYSELKKFVINCSTNGSKGCYCTVEGLMSFSNVWYTYIDKATIDGWPGTNTLNINPNTNEKGLDVTRTIADKYMADDNYVKKIRFTFGITSHDSTYKRGLAINTIKAYGPNCWISPSNMANIGTIYTYDQKQNVTFPSSISAQGNALIQGWLSVSSEIYCNNGQLVATQTWIENNIPIKVSTGYKSLHQHDTSLTSFSLQSTNAGAYQKDNTLASVNYVAAGPYSFCANAYNATLADRTSAFGFNCVTKAADGFAEGRYCVILDSAPYSHAEGLATYTAAPSAHSEGDSTAATGEAAHSENHYCFAQGKYSHAGGDGTSVRGVGAFGHGYYLSSPTDYQFMVGKFNARSDKALFLVGNGTSDSARTNAFEVHLDGTAWLSSALHADQAYFTNGLTVGEFYQTEADGAETLLAVGYGTDNMTKGDVFLVNYDNVSILVSTTIDGDLILNKGSGNGYVYAEGVIVQGEDVITETSLVDAVKFYNHSIIIKKTTSTSDNTKVLLNVTTNSKTAINSPNALYNALINNYASGTYLECSYIVGTLSSYDVTSIKVGYLKLTTGSMGIFIDGIGNYTITSVSDVVSTHSIR